MHLNKNFIILTFIFIYGWNKTFKILALAPNDLFKGKHICQAVIKVNPGHLSESLWCKTDLLSIWGVWAKTGASCEIVSHEERSVSAYLKYPGRPNKCHTQEKFPLLSAHLQKLAINFDHSFPLWRAGGRIIFLSTWCSRVVCSAQILFPHYPWFIDTMTPDGGDTWADGARGWDHSLWHTGHCCDCEPPNSPALCPVSPAWPRIMALIQQPDTFYKPFQFWQDNFLLIKVHYLQVDGDVVLKTSLHRGLLIFCDSFPKINLCSFPPPWWTKMLRQAGEKENCLSNVVRQRRRRGVHLNMHCNDLSLHGGRRVQFRCCFSWQLHFGLGGYNYTSNVHAEFYASDIKMIPTWLNVNCFLHWSSCDNSSQAQAELS